MRVPASRFGESRVLGKASGSGSPRFEIGAFVLTSQLEFVCLGKCEFDPGC